MTEPDTGKPRPPGFDRILPTLKRYAYPPVVVVEVVNRCNLSCIMCPQGKMTRPIGEMREDLFQKIVDDIAAYNPETTQLWLAIMGEVLILGERAFSYLDYAVKRGIKNVNLNTNLLPADESMCRRLIGTGLSRIIVGMDAFSAETYARVRRGGNFERLKRNIETLLDEKRQLQAEKPDIILQYIIQPENAQEVEDFRTYYSGKGLVLKFRQKLGWGTGVEAENLTLPENARDFPCPWLNRTMSVHVTGQVAQCDAAWDGKYYYGDLNTQSIAEVWNGTLSRLRDRHWAGDFSFEPCASCKDWQCGLSEIVY